MDRITRIMMDGPGRVIDNEYERCCEANEEKDLTETIADSLERIEDSLNEAAFTLRKVANGSPETVTRRVERFLDELNDLSDEVFSRRKGLSRGHAGEGSLKEIRERFRKILDRL